MKHLACDTENTTFEKGNPFYAGNKCCVVSYSGTAGAGVVDLEYSGPASRGTLDRIAGLVGDADLLIGFNLKYDLHWLRRYGIQLRPDQRVWDCQLVEYLLSAQARRLESLEAAVDRYALGKKEKGINEYWDLGINTDKIPYDVLSNRALSDSILTEKLALHQMRLLQDCSTAFQRLVHLNHVDLLVLQEMEWNGLQFDLPGMAREQEEVNNRLQQLDRELGSYFPGLSLNWNSTADRSAALYGGVVEQESQEEVGTYKSGPNAGKPKYRRVHTLHLLDRLVDPIAGSELTGNRSRADEGEAEGQLAGLRSPQEDPQRSVVQEGKDVRDGGALDRRQWSTDKSTLPRLKAKGRGAAIIGLLQERQRLEKLDGTYLNGLRARADLMGWTDGVIHGSFNQSTVVTGRLSSSRPNLQNFPEDVDKFMCSRYDLYRARKAA